LGYRPPRELDEVVVVSGQGQPVYGPGPMGWLQRKINEAQQQAMAANGARQASDGGNGKVEVATEDKSAAPKSTANGNGRARGRDGRGKKSSGGKAPVSATRTQERQNGSGAGSSGAVIIPRKVKSTSGNESGD
jgi:hypothetical protein